MLLLAQVRSFQFHSGLRGFNDTDGDSLSTGWKRFSDTEPTRVDENHDAPRESHFAQASRRSRRLRRENAGVDDLGMLETGSGDRQQVEDQDSDEFEEPEVWRDDTRRRGH